MMEFEKHPSILVVFEKHPSILKSTGGKKMIRIYNKLSKVLVEYEMLYYRCWLEQVRILIRIIISFLLNKRHAWTFKYKTVHKF